jgi:transcriptional regulator with XRE-family HTH domain
MAGSSMKLPELGSFIREQRRAARLSLRKLSDLAGISNPYLSQIERGLRKPSAEILQAIAKALRISAETLYEQAGLLESERKHDLVSEILKDALLTERQKQALIETYRSFRETDEEPYVKAAAIAEAVAPAKAPAPRTDPKKVAAKGADLKKLAKKTARKKR